MKHFISFFVLLISVSCFCRQNDTVCGVYEYTYTDSAPELCENQYIVLEKTKDGNIAGYYYGSTDEFDEAREGYPPGFFVAKMDSLLIHKDSICFTLKVSNKDFFAQPIPLSINTASKAHEKKLQVWDSITLPCTSKRYKGIIKNNTLFFGNKESYLNKTFHKIRFSTKR